MKRIEINPKTVQLFDDVFITGNRQDQIHLFGDYGWKVIQTTVALSSGTFI